MMTEAQAYQATKKFVGIDGRVPAWVLVRALQGKKSRWSDRPVSLHLSKKKK